MKRSIIILALVIISLFSIQIVPAHAAPIACSQAALQAALYVSEVIDLPADCTIALDSRLVLPGSGTDNRSVTINGNGAVLDGNNKTAILEVGLSGPVIIDNLTMQNAYSTKGGVLYLTGAEMTIKNSILRNNRGGAISSFFTHLTVINTIIEGNSSDIGGGIQHNSERLVIINSSIIGNYASSRGGGLALSGGSSYVIENSRIANNTAGSGGAILYTTGLKMTGSCIEGNVSNNGFDLMADYKVQNVVVDGNWWGAATGPNTPGADTTNAPVSSWLDAPPPSCNLFASPEYDPARINGHDNAPPVVAFYHEFEDGEGLVVYGPFGGELLIVTPEDIAAVDECPAENTLIAANEDVPVWLYRLSTCWFQINAFTSEGKLYTLIFDQLGPGRESISFEEWIED